MALRNAILTALLDGESSGYDLAKTFDVTLANYWSATSQQLYRELDRMETEGLVSARLVVQERRPNKRLYAITDTGRAALHAFAARAPKPTAIRDELLVQVAGMDAADLPHVREHIAAALDASRTKLERYRRSRRHLLEDRTAEEFLAEAERIGPFLTLECGIVFEEGNVRWYEGVLETLERRGESPVRDETSSRAASGDAPSR
ncbi:PadR family transcriptional regulator [Microbacterium sp. KR10-403]|uniref:PadR family transcriptional regulator n=1 Tax=Microbacterium sp. KR10-403 TaxID=3158581 RepID=UPI0032E36DCF